MGDIDFEKYFKNINMKLKSNQKLSSFEELTLLFPGIVKGYPSKLKTLCEICAAVKNFADF